MDAHRATRSWRRLLSWAVLLAGLTVSAVLLAPAADHRDGPILVNTATQGNRDVNDIYLFRSPTNANNTVFIFTFQPFPGNLTQSTIDPNTIFDIKIDTTGDAVEDITLRMTVGLPDAKGVQPVLLRGLPSSKFPPTGILARGTTGSNVPVAGGGMFRVGIHDDPFFFDAGAFSTFLNTGAGFPRPTGQAHNFFGPNVNTMAMILEIPSSKIGPNNAVIGVWVTTTSTAGAQVDRMGRPAINTALIPPVPRKQLAQGERRNAFNAGLPRNDRRDFNGNMVFVLSDPNGIYKRTPTDAGFLTSALLPDMLLFQLGNPGGFGTLIGPGPGAFTGPFAGGQVLGNGRKLREDVIDIELNLLTNGAIPTDNVPDDNGTRITDGSLGTTAAFPYIGVANLPLNGPGTGPNP
jgi:hypothetical protein